MPPTMSARTPLRHSHRTRFGIDGGRYEKGFVSFGFALDILFRGTLEFRKAMLCS